MVDDSATPADEKITVTNEGERLSQSQIDKMVEEAERFKEDDLKLKEKVELYF